MTLIGGQAPLNWLWQKVSQSVVAIESRGGAGAGFVYGANGWIVTNYHVVQSANEVKVRGYGTESIGKVIATDEVADLALVKSDNPFAQPLRPADEGSLRVGALAMAVGHPIGVEFAPSFGIVSGLSAPQWLNLENPQLIPFDLKLAPGNSGGPVVDATGRLFGVATMIASPGVALASPTSAVDRLVAASRRRLRLAS